ncbi:MAG: S9 family peptidase, partial [Acidobacteriota bacterium]
MRFTHSPSQQPLTPLPPRRRPADLARALLIATLLLMTGAAAGAEEGFRQPSQSLTQLIDAPANPWVIETPDGNGLMVIDRPSLPAIDELAEPELRLAGLRINPRIDTRSRERYGSGLSYIRLEDGGTRQIEGLPADLRWNGFDFSPDGSKVALTHVAEDRAELWIADLETFKAHRLIDRALHLVAGNRPAWLDDSTLVATLVPENRAAPPQPPRVPRGPVVRENLGVKAQARTYQDLLANPHDEALFAHHMSAQIARIGLDGSVEALGEPALVWDVEPSPDGRFLLVQTLQRPFSYLVPAFRFARTVEILDRDGQRVAQLAKLPLAESVPLAYGSVPTGLRSASWRHDAPATVAWAEAQDGGDAGSEAEIRDRLFMLAAPFEAEPTPWVDLALRYAGTTWGHDGLALITSSWWQTRQVQVHWAQPGQPDAEPSLVVERSFEDRYGDPGSPLTVTGKFGRPVLQHPKGQPAVLYLAGNGASPEGDRPFLDRHDLESGEKTRLFRSEAPYFELPIAVLEGDESLLTRRESVDEPPNYRVRELDGDASRAVTRFPHPAEQLAGVQKELVTYPREDGVQLSATLYLPAGYDAER